MMNIDESHIRHGLTNLQTWDCGNAAKAGSGSKLAAFMVSKCIKPSTVETSLKTRV